MTTLTARPLLFGLSLVMLFGFAQEAKSATLLYAMTEYGLLCRSLDGAKTWQNIALPATPGTFQALAVDPENPSNLYVDVSLRGRGAPGAQGNYFFRSSDGGATWSETILANGATADLLAVDRASSNTIYAGLNGLSRSTDSGVTWHATSISAFVESIDPDPHRAGVVYVTTTDGKIYESTDFGATWTPLASSLPPQFNRLLSVAADPNNSNVLWGSGEGSCLMSNNVPFICGLVQSSDGGKTWQAISSVEGWFRNVVVDSRNGNIYAGGATNNATPQALVVRSIDGGKTWANITTGMSKYGVDVHLDPENAANLYGEQANLPGAGEVGPGGGVYVTTNGGASWTLNPVDASQGQYDIVYGFAAVSSKTAAPAAPAISANGVVNGASFQPGVPANSWVTIKGTNLAAVTDDWSKSIVNGALPTSLDGVSVTMGGKPAYVYFISPGQLNVLAPDVPAGPVSVTVTTAGGTSTAFSTTAAAYGPAFFLWPNNQVVATRQDFSYAAKAGTFAGSTTVRAKPGDVLILGATGFGPTIPAAPSGASVPASGGYSTASAPVVTVNGIQATVYGGALAPGSAGLYQIAVQVPTTLADGDWPIQATIGGTQSPAGSILTLHQ